MLVFLNPLHSANRPAFCEAFPAETETHRAAQRAMFGAARTAQLPAKTDDDRAAMIAGINQLLGLRIESRRQLTIEEMQAVVVAIESGAFYGNWQLIEGFQVRVTFSVSVHISPIADDYLTPDYAGYDESFPSREAIPTH
jgi:hypothetical protein